MKKYLIAYEAELSDGHLFRNEIIEANSKNDVYIKFKEEYVDNRGPYDSKKVLLNIIELDI